MKEKWLSTNCNKNLKNKIAIITGANSGLGFECSMDFAKRDCKVIMACKSKERGEKAMSDIKAIYPASDLSLELVDMMSLESVLDFSNRITQNYKNIDYLINNAGIMFPPLARTKEGFESQMGTNHFAHFYLTLKLLPIIRNTKDARIVNISSMAHKTFEYLDLDDINWNSKPYNPQKAYGQSKLANLMFSAKLKEMLQKDGDNNVMVLSAHPGVSNTNLMKGKLVPLLKMLFSPLIQSAFMGAQPMLYAMLEDDVENGTFYGPDGFAEKKGYPKVCKVKATPENYNQQNIDKLWDLSLQLTKAEYPKV